TLSCALISGARIAVPGRAPGAVMSRWHPPRPSAVTVPRSGRTLRVRRITSSIARATVGSGRGAVYVEAASRLGGSIYSMYRKPNWLPIVRQIDHRRAAAANLSVDHVALDQGGPQTCQTLSHAPFEGGPSSSS